MSGSFQQAQSRTDCGGSWNSATRLSYLRSVHGCTRVDHRFPVEPWRRDDLRGLRLVRRAQ